MALQEDVDLLVEYGLFNEDAVGRIANAIRTVRELAGGNSGTGRRGPGRRGRPAGKGPGRPRAAGKEPSGNKLNKMSPSCRYLVHEQEPGSRTEDL